MVHAPLEVASIVMTEAASYLDMVTEAVYEKAYPAEAPVRRYTTLKEAQGKNTNSNLNKTLEETEDTYTCRYGHKHKWVD